MKFAPLFARMLVEEYRNRTVGYADGIIYIGFDGFESREAYERFLRAQATPGPTSRGYCYHLALKTIAAR